MNPTRPIPQSFLTRDIHVSTATYEALQAIAELEQSASADHIAENMLRESLRGKEVEWLVKRRSEDNKKRREEYKARITFKSVISQPGLADADQLP